MPDDVISHAIVLIMLRYNIDADAAQALVMRLSKHQRQPMTDVARALIAEFSAPTTADPSRAEASAQPAKTVDSRSSHDIHVRLAALIRDVQGRPSEIVTARVGQHGVGQDEHPRRRGANNITGGIPGNGYSTDAALKGHSGASGRSLDQQGLAGGTGQRVGWFRFYFDDDRWEWSPEVQRMHGYLPGSVTPTTALVLSHKHPDDYRQVADTIAEIRGTRQAFSSRHRIIDAQEHIHHVVVVGDQLGGEDGEVIGTQGFYIDVTASEQARQDQMTAEIAEITDNRAIIEQVKGMLMVVYEVDEAAAFDLLRWRSQETNVKLRALAEQIAADFAGLSHGGTMPPRSTYDNLLLTAHRRAARRF